MKYVINSASIHKFWDNHKIPCPTNNINFDKSVPNADSTGPSFLPVLYTDFANSFKALPPRFAAFLHP